MNLELLSIRAVDKKGNTVGFPLTRRRQRISSQRFLIKAIENNGKPELIKIDRSGSNTLAIKYIIDEAI